MRKVTFAGTPMGLAWSAASAGFIRSDGLITEIRVADLLDGDAVAPEFTGLPAAGVKPVLLATHDCPADTLRRVGRVVPQTGARALVHSGPVPAAETPELDLLVERLRTVQDVVHLPVVVDPVVRTDQDPADVARALRELCERVWCTFVLDLTSLQQFSQERGLEPDRVIANLPPSRVAYVRVRSSTARPVTSSTRDLVLSTMARWEESPPAIVLSSARPVSMQARELSELMTLSGHVVDPPDWSRVEVSTRTATGRRG